MLVRCVEAEAGEVTDVDRVPHIQGRVSGAPYPLQPTYRWEKTLQAGARMENLRSRGFTVDKNICIILVVLLLLVILVWHKTPYK